MSEKKFTKVIQNDKSVFFDCDDTLVMWNPDGGGMSWGLDHKDAVEFICPNGSYSFWLKPHKKHIQKLKGYARSGWHVVVWSAGGWEWAETVVKTLKLEEYVDIIMSKPVVCFDDLPVGEGIARREYYQDKK